MSERLAKAQRARARQHRAQARNDTAEGFVRGDTDKYKKAKTHAFISGALENAAKANEEREKGTKRSK